MVGRKVGILGIIILWNYPIEKGVGVGRRIR